MLLLYFFIPILKYILNLKYLYLKCKQRRKYFWIHLTVQKKPCIYEMQCTKTYAMLYISEIFPKQKQVKPNPNHLVLSVFFDSCK